MHPSSVVAGSRMGPYEIVSRIGAGGMGEVWKARDTRLERHVAIKVLSAEFAQNAQLKARFEREAKTISQLSHPNICTLHDVGENYLVMELLEGESLAERLARGPLPLPEVLRYGAEVADALDRAHRAGVVHRDLKPGNVMLTRSGAKLLDFGLAKGPVVDVQADGATVQKALTQEGTILGTFQYMSPEQLEGVEADPRTDIFALGAVLYEMATGRRAFQGKTKTSLIAAIVKEEPRPVSELVPLTPPALEHVIGKCLRKEREERWQSAYDVAEEIRWISETGSKAGAPAPVLRRRRVRESAAWITAILFLVAAAAATTLYLRTRAALAAQSPIRTSIVGADGKPYAYGSNSFGAVISPDGRRMVFSAKNSDGVDVLHVRPLDALQAQPLAGTEGASYPFWSPDSRQIGFFAGGKLRKMDANGGPIVTLASVRSARGGAWSRDGVIVFAPDTVGGLSRVPAAGGQVTPVTAPSKNLVASMHRWPSFLPDGKRFLYLEGTAASGLKDEVNAIWVGSLDPNEKPKRLFTSKVRAIYSSGYILHVRDSYLVAQRFDPQSLSLEGDPLPLAENVRQRMDIIGSTYFTASDNGMLLYQGGSAPALQLTWMNREGKALGTTAAPAMYGIIAISRDETRLALSVTDPATGTSDIWLHDLATNFTRRLTFDAANDTHAVFSPDGKKVAFGSNRSKQGQLIMKSTTGGSTEQVLLSSSPAKTPEQWTPDGRYILFNQEGTKNDFWALPTSGDRKPFPLVNGPADEGWGRVSPDGRWLTYLSDESGQYEIFAIRFPKDETGAKWQLTTSGADWIVDWRHDGSELYYLDLSGRLAVLPITTAEEIEAGEPHHLFQTHGNMSWAATRDGSRFLFGREPSGTDDVPTTLVIHWPAALKR